MPLGREHDHVEPVLPEGPRKILGDLASTTRTANYPLKEPVPGCRFDILSEGLVSGRVCPFVQQLIRLLRCKRSKSREVPVMFLEGRAAVVCVGVTFRRFATPIEAA